MGINNDSQELQSLLEESRQLITQDEHQPALSDDQEEEYVRLCTTFEEVEGQGASYGTVQKRIEVMKQVNAGIRNLLGA